MSTTVTAVFIIVLLFAVSAHAETYCQNVNRTGNVANSAALARTMNKWIALKGSNYKTTSKEMKSTITNFCKSNPYGTDEDVTNHLQSIVNVLAAVGG